MFLVLYSFTFLNPFYQNAKIKYHKLVVGKLPSLMSYRKLLEEQTQKIKKTCTKMMQRHLDSTESLPQDKSTMNEMFLNDEQVFPEFPNAISDWYSQKCVTSDYLLPWRKSHVSNTTNISANVTNHYRQSNEKGPKTLFRQNATCVYVTLCTAGSHCKNSGTQATAAINKNLQVCSDIYRNVTYVPNNIQPDTNFNRWTPNSSATLAYKSRHPNSICPDIPLYFLGLGKSQKRRSSDHYIETDEKKPSPLISEFISQAAQSKENDAHQSQSTEMTRSHFKAEIWCQTCCYTGPPCKELEATVSHVKIKPPRTCPVHSGSCAGPNSVVKYSPNDEDAPVIVTTGANPRRGVFEVVIRRLNGAPLAKNELMLEWTPPICTPCGPCPLPWSFPSTCRPKCKITPCRPPICKPPKCCRRICKRPCGPVPRPCTPRPCAPRPCALKSCAPKPCPLRPCPPRPCTPRPCGPVVPCGSMPCGPISCGGPICAKKCYRSACRPSPPLPCESSCRSCPPRSCVLSCSLPRPCLTPCSSPCCDRPCSSSPCWEYPCPSKPCFRTCPVGKCRIWKKIRKPKIKKHRKYISPCMNRSDCCPIVSCRSMPPGCGKCSSCSPCPTGKCCASKTKFPFKPRCCRSACNNCC